MTEITLQDAIAEVKRGKETFDQATVVLRAVASGDLIPLADHKLVVAEALAEVHALRDEVAELREYRDFGPRVDEKRQAAILGLALGSDRIDRMEALQSAEAEVARLREALRRIAETSNYTRSELMQDIALAALTPEKDTP
jgi:hypothetical protein